MDEKKLRSALILKGLGIADLCKAIGMNKVTFYRKLNGKSEFTRDEIVSISKVVELGSEEICDIFFNKEVS